MITILRPLSTSQLLDRVFHLYRNNFLLFVGITAIPQLAVLALRLGDTGYVFPHFAGRIPTPLVIGLASFIAIEIAHAVTVMAVSNLHLDRRTSIGSAYSAAKSSLFRVVGISFAAVMIPVLIAVPIGIILALVFAAVGAGSLAVGNVAVIRLTGGAMAVAVLGLALRWWLAWSLIVPVTVLEGGGLRTSMRRSKTLTLGGRGRIFVVYLLIFVLSWLVGTLFQLPFLLTTGTRALRDPAMGGTLAHVLQAAGGFISTSLLGPLVTIAFTLIYYDQRVRKEGFDLQLMMSTLEGAPQSLAVAPAS